MSTRTIIEINHDYAGTLEQLDMRKLVRMIVDSRLTGELNQAEGKPVNLVSGIRVMAQRHHSEKIKVEFS